MEVNLNDMHRKKERMEISSRQAVPHVLFCIVAWLE